MISFSKLQFQFAINLKINFLQKNSVITAAYDPQDFICPISGEVIRFEPVLLNGNLYERENLEDWMYLNDWTDPANHIA